MSYFTPALCPSDVQDAPSYFVWSVGSILMSFGMSLYYCAPRVGMFLFITSNLQCGIVSIPFTLDLVFWLRTSLTLVKQIIDKLCGDFIETRIRYLTCIHLSLKG